MDRIGAWLWRKHRQRFVPALTGTVTAMVLLSLGVSSTLIGATYLGLSATETLLWGTSVVVFITVGLVAALRTARSFLAPLRRWMAGDDSDPAAAWLTLLRFPHELARRSLLVVVPLLYATTYPIALRLARPDLAGGVALAGAYVVVIGTVVLLIATGVQLLVRPAAADVAAGAPPVDHIDRGAWSIRFRLVAIVVAVTTSGGIVVPALVLGGAATSTDYLLAVVGSVCFGGYIGWVIDIGLVQPTLQPLRDVMAGTVRVRGGDLTSAVPVTSLDELGDLATAFNAMQRGLREREALQAAFGSYVDPALAQRLLDSGSSMFEGEELVVTVMFADVRDFTSYSEGVPPGEAVALLNRLFGVIVPVLHAYGGHANHYLGDGLLAVFGAPQPLEAHADAALAAAVDIQRRVRTDFGTTLRLGIGINTGPVIAGTVGGGGRHEFTVIGDTVNAAARVEQLTKDTGDAILITESTHAALSAPRPRTTSRGAFEVRGKATKLTLHAVNLE